MSITNTIKFIVNHPFNEDSLLRGLDNFIFWQLKTIIKPGPYNYKLVDDIVIIASRSLTGVTGNIYCGLHEFEDMAFVLHFLRPDDLFVDIGANVGTYTLLAGATGASVIAFEPVLSTFNKLKNNIYLNSFKQDIKAINMGLSSESGYLNFTNNLDTINHVVFKENENTQKVEVSTLDLMLENQVATLIKIDVEGFEYEVLKGGYSVLNNPGLFALIIEKNDYDQKYGLKWIDIIRILDEFGFSKAKYNPRTRKLERNENDFPKASNELFIRDADFITTRLRESKKYKIQNKLI